MTDPFAQFKETFFTECDELLADLEEKLGGLSQGDRDPETFNAIFRAVHSIKAGAGAFNFTQMVSFTHNFETLLDDLRSGSLSLDDALLKTLVDASDLLADYVTCAKTDSLPERSDDKKVEARIAAYANCETPEQEVDNADEPSLAAQPTQYHIVFRPKPHLFRYANEPLFLIRELKSLGELTIRANSADLPRLRQIEPEDAYLAWDMDLVTAESEERIAEVFEFVDGDCELEISAIAQEIVAERRRDKMSEKLGLSPKVPQPDSENIAETASSEQPPDLAGPAATTTPAMATRTPAASIRVDVDRVDQLVNMVGELVISQSMLAQEIINTEAGRNLRVTNGLDVLAVHVRELQEQVMAIRMQPVKSLFARLPRVVRDLSRKLGKDVRLELVGEATEVDKTVIEELADPITHMLRNSLDHGLESPEERAETGKPSQGTITISAEHVGGRIVIKLTDDGRGINRDLVKAKAIDRGLVPADAALSDEDIDNLIFHPGFSTAEQVSDLSGRGVGMDVVRRNIQKLGGRVSVQSTPGEGAEFHIFLPLTLAVLDGMIVGVGDEKYVIPIGSIVETVRPRPQDIDELPDGRRLARMRGDYIPLVSLADVFGVVGAEPDPSKALVVFVEADGDRTVGLIVDYLAGQQQVVIKSLESNFRRVDGVASATILGDGSVYLILDIDRMADMARRADRSIDLTSRRQQLATRSQNKQDKNSRPKDKRKSKSKRKAS